MPQEVTALSPQEEQAFRQWAQANQLKDVDHPDAHYDMRGYWKDIASQGRSETSINAQDHKLHFPDTYKQHGHPTFSIESKYSAGPNDGGHWNGDQYVPQDWFAANAAKTDDWFTANALQPMASHEQPPETAGGATAALAAGRALPAAGRLIGRFAADHPAATQKVIGAGVSSVAGGIGAAVGGGPGALVGASIRGVTPTQASIRTVAGQMAGETPQIARNAGRAVAVANYAKEAGLPLKPEQLASTGDAARALDNYAESMGQRVPRVLDQYGKVVVGPEATPALAEAGSGMASKAARGFLRVLAPLSLASGATDVAQAVEPNRHDIGTMGIGLTRPDPTAEDAAAKGQDAAARVAEEDQRKADARAALWRRLHWQ